MLLEPLKPFPRCDSSFGSVLLLSLHADPTTAVGAPENGGVTVYVRELARALVAVGWSVDVVTRRQSPDAPQREVLHGANVIRIDAGPAGHLSNDRIAAYLPQAQSAVEALAAARAYSFVSSHYWLSGIVGGSIAAAYGLPHVHTLHSHGINRKHRDATTLARIEAERELLRTAKIVTLSRAHVAAFRNKYGVDADVHVVPAGVDTERFVIGDRVAALETLGLTPGRPWIGYVGRLAKEKGIDDLLHAMALLLPRRPNAGLFVVGGARAHSRIPELGDLAAQLGIADAVRFLGPIRNERVPKAFQGADVIAVPSHYEAFGLVALEARATGTPIVASDVGGLRELVATENGGVRIPAKNYAAWADALDEVLDPTELQRRRALARDQHGNDVHSWRRIAQKIAAIALTHAHA